MIRPKDERGEGWHGNWDDWDAGFRPWQIWRGTKRTRVVLPMEADDRQKHSHLRPYRADDPLQKYTRSSRVVTIREGPLESHVEFYRACPIHFDEVKDVTPVGPGPEVLKCPHGHRVTSFITMSSTGVIIGQSFKHKDSMIVGGREKRKGPRRPMPPEGSCPHGHRDWSYHASRRGYVCASCKEKKK